MLTILIVFALTAGYVGYLLADVLLEYPPNFGVATLMFGMLAGLLAFEQSQGTFAGFTGLTMGASAVALLAGSFIRFARFGCKTDVERLAVQCARELSWEDESVDESVVLAHFREFVLDYNEETMEWSSPVGTLLDHCKQQQASWSILQIYLVETYGLSGEDARANMQRWCVYPFRAGVGISFSQ